MLKSLHIKNFVLIDEVKIDFSNHLTTITGETGAGKSILLGALNLLLGQRADTTLVYNEEKMCAIEGVFDLSSYSLKSFFEEEDLDYDPSTIIRREIRTNGKSRAFVNGNQVNLTTLSKLADQLIDIHEQFDTHFLKDRKFKFQVLDSLAGQMELVGDYQKKFKKWKSLLAQLTREEEELRLLLQKKDFLEFQLNEIHQLEYEEGELAALEEELEILKSAEMILETVHFANQTFQDSETNILDQIRELNQKLHALPGGIKGAEELKTRLDSIFIELEDLYAEVSRLEDEVEQSPGRMEWVKNRIASIFTILKKHHLDTEKDLLELQHELETQLAGIEDAGTQTDELEKEISSLEKELNDLAKKISDHRLKQAQPTEKAVKEHLNLLHLEKAAFEIKVAPTDELNEFGKNEIQYLFSANPGIPLAPVERVASGGEMSRLALSIKALVAQSIPLPTIVFDEIDAAVSGSAADRIGQLLEELGSHHQVICITHSPQVASRAHKHLYVYKKSEEDSTVTQIRELDQQARIHELAVMMSTNPPSESALENAKYLLGKKRK